LLSSSSNEATAQAEEAGPAAAHDASTPAEAVTRFQHYPQGRSLRPRSIENTKPADVGGFFHWDMRMSEAMKLIVDGYYIRLMNDRKAFEALREHWRKLQGSLEEPSNRWFDVRRPSL
jgi:hypothetical protein